MKKRFLSLLFISYFIFFSYIKILFKAQPKEGKSEGPLGPALTLKYLVYKNLATISKEKDDWHASVSFYLEVLFFFFFLFLSFYICDCPIFFLLHISLNMVC